MEYRDPGVYGFRGLWGLWGLGVEGPIPDALEPWGHSKRQTLPTCSFLEIANILRRFQIKRYEYNIPKPSTEVRLRSARHFAGRLVL